MRKKSYFVDLIRAEEKSGPKGLISLLSSKVEFPANNLVI